MSNFLTVMLKVFQKSITLKSNFSIYLENNSSLSQVFKAGEIPTTSTLIKKSLARIPMVDAKNETKKDWHY